MSFVSFHERGLGLPVDRFMRALPHYYGVEQDAHLLTKGALDEALKAVEASRVDALA